LTFESERNRAVGTLLVNALKNDADSRLDLGCIAAHGTFSCDANGCYIVTPGGKPTTALRRGLIARLETSATVLIMFTLSG